MARLPLQNIPEKDKNEQFHLDTINALLNMNQEGTGFSSERVKDHDNYLIAQGYFDPEQYRYITDIGGMTTPARFVNWPMIMYKLDLLAGELVSQPLQYTAHVTNKTAITRKLDKKIAVAAEVILRPLRREVEQLTGVPFEDEDVGEEIPEDVEQFMAMKFRDNKEIQIQVGLDYLINKYDLKNEFKRGFYDMGITSKEFYKVILKNGDPVPKRLDPRSMIYDRHSDKENLSESRYAGDENYLTINEIIEQYHPDKEQVKWLQELEGQDTQWYMDNNREFVNYVYEPNTELKIRVVEMQWKSIMNMRYVVSPNKYDPETPYLKMVDEKYVAKKDEKLEVKPMTEVRYAVKVGHKLLKWGKCPNRVRYEDNYANTNLDYFGVIKNNFNGITLSIVDCLKNIQIEINTVMFHIAATLARSGGKAVVYDMSQLPEGMTKEDVFYHAKNSGIIPINSKQEGNQIPGGFNQFQSIDFTLSNSVMQLINLKIMLEDTADKLTGISASRSGVNKSSDAVGVNERSVMQSSLITAPLFELHYKVVGQVLNQMANMMGLAWYKEGRMANIFGDQGYEMFKIDPEIALDEYGIVVQNSGREVQNKQMMLQLINQYSSTGSISPKLAIQAVNAQSATQIEAILTSGLAEVEASQLALEERKIQVQEQTNKIEEAKMQIPVQTATIAAQASVQVAEINNNTKLQVNANTIRHNEDKQDVERKTQLDMKFMDQSDDAEKAFIKGTPPEKGKSSKK